jgi:hypothetical protein
MSASGSNSDSWLVLFDKKEDFLTSSSARWPFRLKLLAPLAGLVHEGYTDVQWRRLLVGCSSMEAASVHQLGGGLDSVKCST